MDDLLGLWHKLTAPLQPLDVLLDCFTDIRSGLFDRPAVADSSGKRGAVCRVAFVFGFFFNEDLEAVELHESLRWKTLRIADFEDLTRSR